MSLPVWYHIPSRGYDVTYCLVPYSFWGGLHPGRGWKPPRTSSGGHCSGRYASHWNAFLFQVFSRCHPLRHSSIVFATARILRKRNYYFIEFVLIICYLCVMFSADSMFLATVSEFVVEMSPGDPIIWDLAPINPGGNFDTELGAYTVPVNGYYT